MVSTPSTIHPAAGRRRTMQTTASSPNAPMYHVAKGAVLCMGISEALTMIGMAAAAMTATTPHQVGISAPEGDSSSTVVMTTARYSTIAATISSGTVGCTIHHTARAAK